MTPHEQYSQLHKTLITSHMWLTPLLKCFSFMQMSVWINLPLDAIGQSLKKDIFNELCQKMTLLSHNRDNKK